MKQEILHGLTQKEVAQKHKVDGYNELPDREKKSIIKLVLTLLAEPMIFLLIGAVVVYFLLGDRNEALVLLASVVAIVGISLYQDLRTEKALEALRNLSSPTCVVIREGEHQTIASRELVVGDVVVIAEGGRVPADGTLVSATNLSVNESLLTGESLAVEKTANAVEDSTLQAVYMGTLVVKGHGIFQVTAIGLATEIGKIGDSLNAIKPEKTLLQKEVNQVVKLVAVLALSAAATLTVVFWMLRGDLLHGFLAGLTLSIAILPEEFPVVLTVFMALGAWRLAKNNVLTRKSSAIETLGSASVLCTDKTGTLTQNSMEVMRVTDAEGQLIAEQDKRFDHVVAFGVLASQQNPFDPMEEAFIKKATDVIGDLAGVYAEKEIIKEYPLEETSLSVVHVWGSMADMQPVTIAAKGAPEVIFALCNLPAERARLLEDKVKEFAKEGLRVLGVAKGIPAGNLPEKREAIEYDFLGLVALADPIRPEAAAAVQLCRSAGIRVIMLTGDYAETARRIGGEVGLDNSSVVTGDEFGQMSEVEQDEAIKRVSIFSRVVPAHKLTIINSLKRNGEVVAMTGDGVNDAPALKSAHIGIAMGQRGTDVAREASSIVLLDDNFSSIVQGVRHGRRIFANLKKAMAYILTVHIPIITLSFVPVLFGWPLVLLPIHIVFLEFIIDPSCTLIFEGEPEERGAMSQPPRRLGAPLFSRMMIVRSVAVGALLSLFAVLTFMLTRQLGWSEEESRGATFLIVVLTNLFLIFVLSGRRALAEIVKRRQIFSPLILIVSVTLVIMLLIYTLDPLRALFKIAPLTLYQAVMVIFAALVATLLAAPIYKLLPERR